MFYKDLDFSKNFQELPYSHSRDKFLIKVILINIKGQYATCRSEITSMALPGF